ncbi:RraA family protein [Croceicoccus sediminis]|uniref:RraA family protein n=1 Tax=Croceicoccus sediminis TaxID=2571150 RepID=UPI001182BD5C|nr:RraA family protein [Croceicoccus sediminis]
MTGFSISQRNSCASQQDVERYRQLPVAVVSDAMNRLSAGGARLRKIHREGLLIGPAVTVRTRPGDNLMVHKALDMAVAGDVVVVDAGGDLTNAIIGELMVAYARKKRLAGIVINGAIRDFGELSKGDFPVFAAGVTHRGPYKDGPGEVNKVIALDGMPVQPGDLVMGDEDGLIAIPQRQLDTVYAAALAKHQAETAQMQAIERGENDRTWVDRALMAAGCTGMPGVAA